ncbi:hypothetical protein FB451DRAFT_1289145 [Mycena latifolia]|nr:hypothetical protein FB451DRAFT_1289145 [Mycena latifolia]
METPLRIPPEICCQIAEHCNPGRLGLLCRVSSDFLVEGQRILYRTVDLRNSSMRKIKAWCLAVTRNENLACLVHSLALRLPDVLRPADAEQLGPALARCTQLKELEILHQLHEPDYVTRGFTIQWWILNQSSFRLTKFRNKYFRMDLFVFGMAQFWDAQCELRVLSIPHAGNFPCRDDTQLPSLVALETSAQALPLGPRPLECLKVHITYDIFRLAPLQSCASTLTTLTVVLHLPDILVTEIVNAVREAVPNILHFNITQMRGTFPPTSVDSLIPLFTGFQKLESVVLQVREALRDHATAPSTWQAERLAEWKLFGCALMDTSKTLRRVEIGTNAVLDIERTYIFTRVEPGGDILCMEKDGFEWDVTSDFWSV